LNEDFPAYHLCTAQTFHSNFTLRLKKKLVGFSHYGHFRKEVKPERQLAWTEYSVHDDQGGASLASFTAMPLASDFEAAARRVGHAFHNLTCVVREAIVLEGYSNLSASLRPRGHGHGVVVVVSSAEYGLAEAILVVVLAIVTVELIPSHGCQRLDGHLV
jgi:hypothetical protein